MTSPVVGWRYWTATPTPGGTVLGSPCVTTSEPLAGPWYSTRCPHAPDGLGADCRCGIWAWASLEDLRAGIAEPDVFGLVEGHGQVHEWPGSWRAERIRVLVLLARPELLPLAVPDVPVATIVRQFPGPRAGLTLSMLEQFERAGWPQVWRPESSPFASQRPTTALR